LPASSSGTARIVAGRRPLPGAVVLIAHAGAFTVDCREACCC